MRLWLRWNIDDGDEVLKEARPIPEDAVARIGAKLASPRSAKPTATREVDMRRLVFVALLAVGACTARATEDGIDVDPVTDRIGNWNATLRSENNSGISGAVAAR